MPEPSATLLPGNLLMSVYRGDSYRWEFVLWQDSAKTQPVDLTGATAKSEIRDKPGGTLLASFNCSITLPNTIILDLLAPSCAALPVSGGVWDLQLTYSSSGAVSTIIGGPIAVTADVTDSGGAILVTEEPVVAEVVQPSVATSWRSINPRRASNG